MVRPDAPDEHLPLADEVSRLMARHRARQGGSHGQAARAGAKRDVNDVGLIAGVADQLAKWQARPRAAGGDEEELLSWLHEWINTSEARRRRGGGGPVAARDEDDVLLIDALAGLAADRRAKRRAVAKDSEDGYAPSAAELFAAVELLRVRLGASPASRGTAMNRAHNCSVSSMARGTPTAD